MVDVSIAIGVIFISIILLTLFYAMLLDGFRISKRIPDEFQSKIDEERTSYSIINGLIMGIFPLIDQLLILKFPVTVHL